MTRRFRRFACIDWSGAKGERQKGIAVAVSEGPGTTPRLIVRRWSRQAVLDWLLDHARRESDLLVGIDFSTALPFLDAGAYFPGWADSPADARALWRQVDRLCADDPHLEASAFIDHPEISRHFRRHGGRQGELFGAGNGRYRLVERLCRDGRHGPATSCFNLVGAAQVGKSSLTGMRLFHRLDGRLPIWPYDHVPGAGPIVVEIYTAIAATTAGLPKGRTKIRDPETLDRALTRLNSSPHAPLASYDDHATDAILAAAWLRAVASDSSCWRPNALTPELARTEGWTFGVR